ncbi:hypothetical protein FDA52_12680 [Clostridium botulinum]|nr:hypothetical protein [Clostridium botulinum]NFI53812.1 hypothetical protein [Clostridium botulinum]
MENVKIKHVAKRCDKQVKKRVKKFNFNSLKNLLTEKKLNVIMIKSLKGDTIKQKLTRKSTMKIWSLKIEQKSRNIKINQQFFI